MTFKELLDSVRFEDVTPHIVRMYPDMEHSLGWYKIHFDMLRLMQPVFHEDANDKVCNITMKDWEDGSGLQLDAYPMEGDLWEPSLRLPAHYTQMVENRRVSCPPGCRGASLLQNDPGWPACGPQCRV